MTSAPTSNSSANLPRSLIATCNERIRIVRSCNDNELQAGKCFEVRLDRGSSLRKRSELSNDLRRARHSDQGMLLITSSKYSHI